jgi:hypothetical protein
MIHPAAAGDGPRATIGPELAPGLDLVPSRRLGGRDLRIRFTLGIGDRPLVTPGTTVDAGTPLVERRTDVSLEDVAPRTRPGPFAPLGSISGPPETAVDADRRSGAWIGAAGGAAGELAFRVDGRWRMAVGAPVETLEAPAEGVVREVRPGIELTVDVPGVALLGVQALGGPARGRLEIAASGDGETRPGAIDVGRAGAILVFDARVDAETLSRARAMGVRGIVVAALSDKDGRDFEASELRQRASLHRPAPFGVLVLDGTIRRPIAEPVLDLLRAHAGREVGLAADPPCLLLGPGAAQPERDPVHVRIVHGPWAGREGRWEGLAGARRFRAGAHLEAGRVRFDDGTAAVVPLADLERFA